MVKVLNIFPRERLVVNRERARHCYRYELISLQCSSRTRTGLHSMLSDWLLLGRSSHHSC